MRALRGPIQSETHDPAIAPGRSGKGTSQGDCAQQGLGRLTEKVHQGRPAKDLPKRTVGLNDLDPHRRVDAKRVRQEI